MFTKHQIHFEDARQMESLSDESIEIIVTSPPYPMIQMWDSVFTEINSSIGKALSSDNGQDAFELMHLELDKVWTECYRVLKPGGIACINIGDAVRTISNNFQMFSNHSRIINSMCRLGLTLLPDILWRKQTNAPNKFMGSGMLPAGAYVTYEHEYILVFRKGEKRDFKADKDKELRRSSAYFWEERNVWFSDVWNDLKGTTQNLHDKSTRNRSAAYPFELAYRLICMYSTYNDTVLDPFLGTATTTAAAISSGRNSVGIEIDNGLRESIYNTINQSLLIGKSKIKNRLKDHHNFINARLESGKTIKHENKNYHFPVITSQEKEILFYNPLSMVSTASNEFEVGYEPMFDLGLDRKEIPPVDTPTDLPLFDSLPPLKAT